MKKSVGNHIKGLDKFPATPQTYWGGIKSKQTILGGIIAIIFFILTLILVITKTISIINKEEINLDSFIRRDMSSVSIAEEQIILVMLYVDIVEQIVFVLDPDQLPQYGVTAIMIQVEADMIPNQKFKSPNITTVKMERCKGKNKQIFLCAYGLKYQPQCSNSAMDNQVCHHTKQYHLQINKCNKEDDPSCSPDVNPNLFPSLLLYDTKFNVYELNNSNIFRTSPILVNNLNLNSGVFIDPDQSIIFQVPVSKLIIQLQQSVLPRSVPIFENNNSTIKYFYPTQSITSYKSDQKVKTSLIQFYIHRSPYTEIYRRYFPRFDTMLGEVFGFMGLISIFMAFLCSGYNNWLMQKHIKNKLNQHEQGRQNNSYFEYLKEKAKGLTDICRHKKIKQSFLESQSLRSEEQKESCIDMIQMYKQIKKIKSQNRRKQQSLNQMKSKINKLNDKIQQLEQKDRLYQMQQKRIKQQ